MRRTLSLGALVLAAIAWPATAQSSKITVGELPCLPLDGNGVVTATVTPDLGSLSVRLYFRRLSVEVEDFYYVEMRPGGNGSYWSPFPDPEDQPATKKSLKNASEEEWAKWWKAKEASDHRDPNDDLNKQTIRERASLGKIEKRAWMTRQQDADLQRWLDRLKNEPAEYYVAVYDTSGRLLDKSEMRVVEVKKDNCPVSLTPQQEGYAQNLVVGETRDWQAGKSVFHWECDGIVTRIDPQGVMRPDDACRACVIAWWANPKVIVPAAMGTLTLVAITTDNPQPASPSAP